MAATSSARSRCRAYQDKPGANVTRNHREVIARSGIHLHGTEDGHVPIAIGREYATRARRAGSPIEFVEPPAVEHFALIDPLSTAWPHVLAALAR